MLDNITQVVTDQASAKHISSTEDQAYPHLNHTQLQINAAQILSAIAAQWELKNSGDQTQSLGSFSLALDQNKALHPWLCTDIIYSRSLSALQQITEIVKRDLTEEFLDG